MVLINTVNSKHIIIGKQKSHDKTGNCTHDKYWELISHDVTYSVHQIKKK